MSREVEPNLIALKILHFSVGSPSNAWYDVVVEALMRLIFEMGIL